MPTRNEQRSRLKRVSRFVWKALYDGSDETYEEYFARIVYVYEFKKKGGLVIYRDDVDPDLCWIDAAGDLDYIPVEKFTCILHVVKHLGVGVLAANTKRLPQLEKLYQWAGWQQIDDNVWSIRLNE